MPLPFHIEFSKAIRFPSQNPRKANARAVQTPKSFFFGVNDSDKKMCPTRSEHTWQASRTLEPSCPAIWYFLRRSYACEGQSRDLPCVWLGGHLSIHYSTDRGIYDPSSYLPLLALLPRSSTAKMVLVARKWLTEFFFFFPT